MTRYIATTQDGGTFEVPSRYCGADVTDADDALSVARAVNYDRAVTLSFAACGPFTDLTHDLGPAASLVVRRNPVIKVEPA